MNGALFSTDFYGRPLTWAHTHTSDRFWFCKKWIFHSISSENVHQREQLNQKEIVLNQYCVCVHTLTSALDWYREFICCRLHSLTITFIFDVFVSLICLFICFSPCIANLASLKFSLKKVFFSCETKTYRTTSERANECKHTCVDSGEITAQRSVCMPIAYSWFHNNQHRN